MKKFIVSAALIVAIFTLGAPTAKAQTAEELQAQIRVLILQVIDILNQQIATLTAQLVEQNKIISTQTQVIQDQQNDLGGQDNPPAPTPAPEPTETPVPQPTLEVSIQKSGTTKDGDPLPEGEFALVAEVSGEWDLARLWLWRPDGSQAIGVGFTDEREYRAIFDKPGEYKWEATAILCGDKSTGAKCVASKTSEKTIKGAFKAN